jgi:hypothetical protein
MGNDHHENSRKPTVRIRERPPAADGDEAGVAFFGENHGCMRPVASARRDGEPGRGQPPMDLGPRSPQVRLNRWFGVLCTAGDHLEQRPDGDDPMRIVAPCLGQERLG